MVDLPKILLLQVRQLFGLTLLQEKKEMLRKMNTNKRHRRSVL